MFLSIQYYRRKQGCRAFLKVLDFNSGSFKA